VLSSSDYCWNCGLSDPDCPLVEVGDPVISSLKYIWWPYLLLNEVSGGDKDSQQAGGFFLLLFVIAPTVWLCFKVGWIGLLLGPFLLSVITLVVSLPLFPLLNGPYLLRRLRAALRARRADRAALKDYDSAFSRIATEATRLIQSADCLRTEHARAIEE